MSERLSEQHGGDEARQKRGDAWWKRAAVLGTWADALARIVETIVRDR